MCDAPLIHSQYEERRARSYRAILSAINVLTSSAQVLDKKEPHTDFAQRLALEALQILWAERDRIAADYRNPVVES